MKLLKGLKKEKQEGKDLNTELNEVLKDAKNSLKEKKGKSEQEIQDLEDKATEIIDTVIESKMSEKSEEETLKEFVEKKGSDSSNANEYEEDDYSLSAFLLTFMYYFAKKDYTTGLAFLVTTVILPSNLYFVVGLIAGFFVGKGKIRNKELTASGIFVCCLSVVAFSLLKGIRYNLIGSI